METIFYSKKCDGKKGGHTLKDLKAICRTLGLKVSGNKEFLCNQLTEYFEKNNQKNNSHIPVVETSPSPTSAMNNIKFDNLPVEIQTKIVEDVYIEQGYLGLKNLCQVNKKYNDICQYIYKNIDKYKKEEYVLYLENTDYYSLKKVTNSGKLKDKDFLFTFKDEEVFKSEDEEVFQSEDLKNKYYIDKMIKLSDILSVVVGGERKIKYINLDKKPRSGTFQNKYSLVRKLLEEKSPNLNPSEIITEGLANFIDSDFDNWKDIIDKFLEEYTPALLSKETWDFYTSILNIDIDFKFSKKDKEDLLVLTSDEEVSDQEYWAATTSLYSRYFNFNRIASILKNKKKDLVELICFEEVLVQNIFFVKNKIPSSWKTIFKEIDMFYN